MDTKTMHKRGWLFPALIVAVNAAMILILWSTLQEYLPAHFDLEGNASGSIPRTALLYYPLIGAVIGLVAYWIRCRVEALLHAGRTRHPGYCSRGFYCWSY